MLMKKQIIQTQGDGVEPEAETGWLNVEEAAQVELESEDPAHPIEAALVPGLGGGWRAAAAGPQTIRLLFFEPVPVSRILLEFEEGERERTQEFVLRWRGREDSAFREIVRQQWNFSPSGNTKEREEFRVELARVSVLEVRIIPDISGGDARASLARWRVG